MTNLKKQATSKRKSPPDKEWSHLDQLLTPVQMMTESDLQKELDYYAGSYQFRYTPNESSSTYSIDQQRPRYTTPQLNIPADQNDYNPSFIHPPAQYKEKSNIDHLNSINLLFDRPSTSEAPLLLNHENMYQSKEYSNHSTPINSTPSSPNQTYFDQTKANMYLSNTNVSDLLVGQDTSEPKKKPAIRFKKDKKQHPLDYLLLSRHNKNQQESSKKEKKQPASKKATTTKNVSSDEEFDEEEEPVIGDGAQSYSSMGSNSSRTSLTKDDKRRRNTAASARFRIKKKMREQALQSTACEMTDKAKMMEQRVHDLEREIKWLKALVVEKNDTRLEQLVRERPAASIAFPLYQSSNEDEEGETYQY